MLDECRPAADYVMSRTSRFHERTPHVENRTQRVRQCFRCGKAFPEIQMAHVGEGTYECTKCLGIG